MLKKLKIARLFISFIVVFTSFAYSQSSETVFHIRIDGSINPSTSDYIHKAIHEAKNNNANCIVIELNTPGGLLKSTRYIVSDILTS